jgi:hypothetical protein
LSFKADGSGGHSNGVLNVCGGMLEESLVMKDVKMAMAFMSLMEGKLEYFDRLLKIVVQSVTECVSITDRPRNEQISSVWKNLGRTCGWATVAKEASRLEKLSTTRFKAHNVRAGDMPGLYSEALCKCLPGGCV